MITGSILGRRQAEQARGRAGRNGNAGLAQEILLHTSAAAIGDLALAAWAAGNVKAAEEEKLLYGLEENAKRLSTKDFELMQPFAEHAVKWAADMVKQVVPEDAANKKKLDTELHAAFHSIIQDRWAIWYDSQQNGDGSDVPTFTKLLEDGHVYCNKDFRFGSDTLLLSRLQQVCWHFRFDASQFVLLAKALETDLAPALEMLDAASRFSAKPTRECNNHDDDASPGGFCS